MAVKIKLLLSAVIIVGTSFVEWMLATSAPIISGDLAVRQLNPSNSDYFVAQAGNHFNGSGTLAGFVGLVLLGVLWWPNIVAYLDTLPKEGE